LENKGVFIKKTLEKVAFKYLKLEITDVNDTVVGKYTKFIKSFSKVEKVVYIFTIYKFPNHKAFKLIE
jgi:hypothetical protein